LVLNYDIKLPNGETERYKNVEIGRSIIPAPGKTVMLKRVVV
jgi:hypothetical protein